jgi:NAD(P)-dependent dehydrogenase (short-subunit alcohol dehydrogenase family)
MIAAGFIEAGARVYISSRDAQACDKAAAQLGQNCKAIPEDVSSVEGCARLADALSGHEYALDILVNNAGAAWGAPFESFPETGWDKVMNINLKAPFFLTQKLLPLLQKSGRPDRPAKVINIGSIDGQRPSTWETYSYQASKAALMFLTKKMAVRLAPDRIHVTAIAPGAFASDMNKAARDNSAEIAKAIPAGRIGNANDIAATAIFLASLGGDYVVGDTITLDGGLVHATCTGANPE